MHLLSHLLGKQAWVNTEGDMAVRLESRALKPRVAGPRFLSAFQGDSPSWSFQLLVALRPHCMVAVLTSISMTVCPVCVSWKDIRDIGLGLGHFTLTTATQLITPVVTVFKSGHILMFLGWEFQPIFWGHNFPCNNSSFLVIFPGSSTTLNSRDNIKLKLLKK